MEELFDIADKENKESVRETIGDKIIAKAEEEFKGYSEEENSRQDEETQLKAQLKKLEVRLRQCRNIKNTRLVEANKKRADQRKIIKKNIADCKLRLYEITQERKGSRYSSKDIIENEN